MSLAIIYTRASFGISAPLITVEVHLSAGMANKSSIVGLPEKAVKESINRIRSALINSRFEFPSRRLTINLAPADLPKEGGCFDLPIALGILAASGQIPRDKLCEYEFSGELALSGELRPIRSVLPTCLATSQAKRTLVIPQQNSAEATLLQYSDIFSAHHLLEVCAHLKGEKLLSPCVSNRDIISHSDRLDLADVKGQPHARRSLEIAAAGKHSLLFIGPPGTGKTMLASRLPSILPDISDSEALETAAIASVSSDGFNHKQWKQIPFRSPHHSSSSIALVGGGRPPRPGEISLAHHGVLFLDELPEFSRHVLECLREPLESGFISVSRAAFQTVFPARFQLIAAMNPCPCGYAGSPLDECQCSPEQIKRYVGKISGPLLDRIDMHVEVARLPADVLDASASSEKSSLIRERVIKARRLQLRRQNKLNFALTVSELNHYSNIEEQAKLMLNQVMAKFNLSARAYHRIIKVALTIADLVDATKITPNMVSEALHYRCLDKRKVLI